MKRFKIVGLCLAAVFAISAVASASASAADKWEVGGSQTFGSTALTTESIPITGGVLIGDGIEVTCTALKIAGGELKQGSTNHATSISFTGCKEVIDETKCELSSTTITTGAVNSVIVGTNEIEFTAETPPFVTIKIVAKAGKTCVIEGSYAVTGDARATLGTPNTNEVSHTLTLNSKSALKINSNAATIAGSGSLKLATAGLTWSMQP
jgi:hypothetical protein